MKALNASELRVEIPALFGLLLALVLSGALALRNIADSGERIRLRVWMDTEAEMPAQTVVLQGVGTEGRSAGISAEARERELFSSELRVVAIGSAYPIPYEAETCPFTKTPQPAMNQLDRDADGITDDWELRYGLDKYNAADAKTDMDDDGFSNLEEFHAGSDPQNPALHPPYATKLRFVKRKEVPFPLVFQGVTELSDGRKVFQLNAPASGLTHFASIGEAVQNVVLQRFIPQEEGVPARLYVMHGSTEIELRRGEVAADPESQAELINILDRSSIIVTMDALLSLRNDEYTVLGVYPDKVVVRQLENGEVVDIIGLADGER